MASIVCASTSLHLPHQLSIDPPTLFCVFAASVIFICSDRITYFATHLPLDRARLRPGKTTHLGAYGFHGDTKLSIRLRNLRVESDFPNAPSESVRNCKQRTLGNLQLTPHGNGRDLQRIGNVFPVARAAHACPDRHRTIQPVQVQSFAVRSLTEDYFFGGSTLTL
jgi:hypothetical protein